MKLMLRLQVIMIHEARSLESSLQLELIGTCALFCTNQNIVIRKNDL